MINEIISEIKDAEASFSVYLKNGPWERCAGVYCEKKSSELHPITRLPDANAYFGRFLLSGSWPGASGNDAAGLADNISMANGQTT